MDVVRVRMAWVNCSDGPLCMGHLSQLFRRVLVLVCSRVRGRAMLERLVRVGVMAERPLRVEARHPSCLSGQQRQGWNWLTSTSQESTAAMPGASAKRRRYA